MEAELKALMLQGLAGDAGAHRALLRALQPRLRAFFRSRLGAAAEADAEDLVQETLIAIHTRRDTYDPSYPFSAWAYAIARHRMIDMIRRTKRRGISVPVEDAAHELFADAADEAADARRDLTRLLAQLPEKQREAIRLTKLEELSVREAAVALNLTEPDVKISVHRGLKALTRLIAEGAAP